MMHSCRAVAPLSPLQGSPRAALRLYALRCAARAGWMGPPLCWTCTRGAFHQMICLRCASTTTPSSSSDGAAPTAPFHRRPYNDDADGDDSPALTRPAPIADANNAVELWNTLYRPLLFPTQDDHVAAASSSSAPAEQDANEGRDTSEIVEDAASLVADLLPPTDPVAAHAYVRDLCALIETVSAQVDLRLAALEGESLGKNSDPLAHPAVADEVQCLDEMIAFLYAVIDSLCVRGRGADAGSRSLDTSTDADNGTGTVANTQTSTAPPPAQRSRGSGLRRGEAERTRDALRPVPLSQVSDCAAVVRTAVAVLECCSSRGSAGAYGRSRRAPLGRRTRHALLAHALPALGVAGQLGGPEVAGLAVVMAACWQDYAAETQLRASQGLPLSPPRATPVAHAKAGEGLHRENINDDPVASAAVLSLLARRHLPRYRAAESRDEQQRQQQGRWASDVRLEEERETREVLSGLTSGVQPVSVIEHLHLLAGAVAARIRATMIQRHRLWSATAPSLTVSLRRSPGGEPLAGGEKEAVVVVRPRPLPAHLQGLAQRQEEGNRGELGLLSLAERREREAAASHTPRNLSRQRRTLGSLSSKRAQEPPGGASDPANCATGTAALTPSSASFTVPSMSFSDFADAISALASMRYPDPHFWRLVSDFAVDETFACALRVEELAAAAEADLNSGSTEDSKRRTKDDAATARAVADDFMRSVRHVLFALHRARGHEQPAHYAAVMTELVRTGWLEAEIPPPLLE